MRGLKLVWWCRGIYEKVSHLLQMRGLKLISSQASTSPSNVASFTDAWIETNGGYDYTLRLEVASFTDAWIETRSSKTYNILIYVASFTDAWIET